MKNIFILVFFIYSTCNLFASELTLPKPLDFGELCVLKSYNNYFDIENNTKDTFFIKSIGEIIKYDFNIYLDGNRLSSSGIWESLDYSPKIILPNEKRTITYKVIASYEDSVSLSGGKLNTGFKVEYHKYNSDSLQYGYINIIFSVKNIKNKILSNSGGLSNRAFRCPGAYKYLNQQYITFYNTYDNDFKVDSLKFWGGDSIVNFYGLVNQKNPDNGYPNVEYDSLPYSLKGNSYVSIGWFAKNIGTSYSKKAYLNVYLTDSINKQIILYDSIYVSINSEHGALIENSDNSLKAKLNQKLIKNEKIFVNVCSFNSHTLDSITQVGWDDSEFKIYSPLGNFPLKLESGFNYYINYEFTPNKVGEVIGKLIAHFRDENNQYYYRY
ncbi:MAG: hypothetical protein NTW25_12450, partial [Candidatus Kapabacteria bacterium]|nr:hypothetical protein [Candidatus Kapabacteria bacterium]